MDALTDQAKDNAVPIYQRISLNALWLFISRLATQGSGIVFTMLAARSLGSASFGNLTYILTIVFIANILTTFGTDTYLIREFPRNRQGFAQTAVLILGFQIIISIAVIMILWIGADYLFTLDHNSNNALRLYSLALIPMAFYGVASTSMRAKERMDRILVLTIAISLIQIAGCIVLYGFNSSLSDWTALLLMVQTGGALVAIVLGFPFTIRNVLKDTALDVVKNIIQLCWPLALISVVSMLYQRIEIFLLARTSAHEMLGQYAAAARVVESVKILHISFFGAVFPSMTRAAYSLYKATDKKILDLRIEQRPYLFLVGIVLIVCLIITIFAKPLVALLFGEEFLLTYPILQVLIWILIPYSISALMSLRLVIIGEEKGVLGTNLISLFLTGLISMALITQIGVFGAVIGALAGECLLACILTWLWRDRSSR